MKKENTKYKKPSKRVLEVNGALAKHASYIYNLECKLKEQDLVLEKYVNCTERLLTIMESQSSMLTEAEIQIRRSFEILENTDRKIKEQYMFNQDKFDRLFAAVDRIERKFVSNCKHSYKLKPDTTIRKRIQIEDKYYKDILIGNYICPKCGNMITKELSWLERIHVYFEGLI